MDGGLPDQQLAAASPSAGAAFRVSLGYARRGRSSRVLVLLGLLLLPPGCAPRRRGARSSFSGARWPPFAPAGTAVCDPGAARVLQQRDRGPVVAHGRRPDPAVVPSVEHDRLSATARALSHVLLLAVVCGVAAVAAGASLLATLASRQLPPAAGDLRPRQRGTGGGRLPVGRPITTTTTPAFPRPVSWPCRWSCPSRGCSGRRGPPRPDLARPSPRAGYTLAVAATATVVLVLAVLQGRTQPDPNYHGVAERDRGRRADHPGGLVRGRRRHLVHHCRQPVHLPRARLPGP